MKRSNRQKIKDLDMDILKAGFLLQRLLIDRARLDRAGTIELIASIHEMLRAFVAQATAETPRSRAQTEDEQ